MAMVSKLLHEDPDLDRAGADALETIITAAYDRFRRQDERPLVFEGRGPQGNSIPTLRLFHYLLRDSFLTPRSRAPARIAIP